MFNTGPAFNIFLRLCNFHMGPFVVNKYTSPGVRTTIQYGSLSFAQTKKCANTLFPTFLQLFMCLLWILLQLAVVFMYWDLPRLERMKAHENSTDKSREEENVQGLVKDEEEENDEGKPLMGSQELVGSYGSVVTPNPLRNHSSAASNDMLNHTSPSPTPPPSETHESLSPFKNFSISRGR